MAEQGKRSFTLRNLLVLTTISALLFGVLRWLGWQLFCSLFFVAHAFAPAIAMMNLWLLRDHSSAVRYAVAGLTLVSSTALMCVLCGIQFGSEAIPLVLLGTLIEWPGQIAVLVCLRLLTPATLPGR